MPVGNSLKKSPGSAAPRCDLSRIPKQRPTIPEPPGIFMNMDFPALPFWNVWAENQAWVYPTFTSAVASHVRKGHGELSQHCESQNVSCGHMPSTGKVRWLRWLRWLRWPWSRGWGVGGAGGAGRGGGAAGGGATCISLEGCLPRGPDFCLAPGPLGEGENCLLSGGPPRPLARGRGAVSSRNGEREEAVWPAMILGF